MKVFVTCDDRGEVKSVAIPDPAVAGRVSLVAPSGGSVHVLEIDSRALNTEDLLDPRSEAARDKVYEKLQALIATAGARRGRRRPRRRRAKR